MVHIHWGEEEGFFVRVQGVKKREVLRGAVYDGEFGVDGINNCKLPHGWYTVHEIHTHTH